jgi:polyhydroxyalkanoate synthesis regulator phasin
MKKNLLALAVTISILSGTSLVLAFDFESLDNKIQKGEVTKEQAKKIVDKAIKKGDITEDQVREHMEQRRGDCRRPDRDGFMNKLKEAGVTKEEMDSAHQKGPDAVKQLFESHGIKAPECGRPPFGPPPEGRKGEISSKNFRE